MAWLYLFWALDDTESRNGLQLIQGTTCVPQTTSADHWHLVGRNILSGFLANEEGMENKLP